MNKWTLILTLFILAACTNKEKEGPDNTAFIPVSGIIRAQIRDVDTSLYSIIKIETVNEKADTSYIKREEFKNYAKDFLSLPDLNQKKFRGDYVENNFYDESLQSIVLSYTATDPDLETTKEELLVDPNPEGTDTKVKTIIAETSSEEKDVNIRKNMIWHVDRRFQVITTRHHKDGKEEVKKLQVIWNF
jgi:hypothetical protein